MGLFNVNSYNWYSQVEVAKIAKLVILHPFDESLVLNRSVHNPRTHTEPTNGLTDRWLFSLSRGVIGRSIGGQKLMKVPGETLGHIYVAPEPVRHILPFAVVRVPVNTRGRDIAELRLSIEDTNLVTSDTAAYCGLLVARAVAEVAHERPTADIQFSYASQ